MGAQLASLVASVNEDMDIPNDRIVIGGFSQGGHMALQLCYRFLPTKVAGVFALSSFLANESRVYDRVTELPTASPLFMGHGKHDSLVPFSWGKNTFDKLISLGLRCQFHEFDIDHELDEHELILLKNWILKRLEGRNQD